VPIENHGRAHPAGMEEGTDLLVKVGTFHTKIVDGILAIQAAPLLNCQAHGVSK